MPGQFIQSGIHSALPSFFYILPLLYYLIQSMRLRIALSDPVGIFSHSSYLFPVLFILPFLIGYGMNRGKRWIWIVVTEYSAVFIIYLCWKISITPDLWHIAALAALIPVFGTILYRYRSKVKLAYREDFLARSWRHARRYRLAIPVSIDNKMYTSADISVSGLSIAGQLNISSPVIILRLNEHEFILQTRMVRTTGMLTAFQFTEIDANRKRLLKVQINRMKQKEYNASRKLL